MSASHNPGGPKEDWGIKFNYTNGEPAPEKITDKIFGFTQKINELKIADIPDTDLSKLGTSKYGDFEVREFLVGESHLNAQPLCLCNTKIRVHEPFSPQIPWLLERFEHSFHG